MKYTWGLDRVCIGATRGGMVATYDLHGSTSCLFGGYIWFA